jgi:hypothetical protein
MKKIILFFFLTLLLFSFKTEEEIKELDKKIRGHWVAVSTKDSLLTLTDFIQSGKEITFELKKYNEKFYQWAGGCYNGIEFTTNKEFNFYNNVLCSTESSPKSNESQTWEIINNNIIRVKGEQNTFHIRVISISKKILKAVFTK